jgi:hypothetical protein
MKNSHIYLTLFSLYHCLSLYNFKQSMTIGIQIVAVLAVICLPVISIGALVLTLAALNLSLGIRRFYVKILSFVFDYATKIKKDKEISIDSNEPSTEPATPQVPINDIKIESSIIENSFDDLIELSSNSSITDDSKIEVRSDDELQPTVEQSQRISRVSSQIDIQFKLGNLFSIKK